MRTIFGTSKAVHLIAGTMLLLLLAGMSAQATIDGINVSGPVSLTVKRDSIKTADGGSWLIWGYAHGAGRAQYPGPTMIVQQNDTLEITLTNTLTVPVSIIFPGQEDVVAENTPGECSNPGLLTCEAAPSGGTVTYRFVAKNPGTYIYQSGTDQALQVEMGLFGALIVRPTLGADYAYNDPKTKFGPNGHEFLFLLSEMDERVHGAVEFGDMAKARFYLADYWATYWFINGRTAPDTMSAAGDPILPTQPYNAFPRMHIGDTMLVRLIGADRHQHPFHTHGNHVRVIAKDGKLLESAPGAGLDISTEVFVIQSIPGETTDALFSWTGKNLGWDIFGTATPHSCSGLTAYNPADPDNPNYYDPVTMEFCPDHGKAFPVILPETQYLTVGPFYSGSPFMGALGALPPGEGGLNPNGGFPYMWHSHDEKELTNSNIFPGGMLTMLIIEHPTAPIE